MPCSFASRVAALTSETRHTSPQPVPTTHPRFATRVLSRYTLPGPPISAGWAPAPRPAHTPSHSTAAQLHAGFARRYSPHTGPAAACLCLRTKPRAKVQVLQGHSHNSHKWACSGCYKRKRNGGKHGVGLETDLLLGLTTSLRSVTRLGPPYIKDSLSRLRITFAFDSLLELETLCCFSQQRKF